MTVKQIYPQQFLKIRKEQILLFSALLLLLLGFVLLIVFLANIKKETTNDGEEVYMHNSKTVLYISFVCIILTLGLLGFILYNYVKIFGTSRSKIFTFLITMMILTFILFIVDIVYIAKKFNYCADGYEFNKDFGRCVPICSANSYLDDKGECAQGCQSSSDCEDNATCINNLCCDLDKNEVVDNQCCPKGNVHVKSDGKTKYCCAQELCEAKGKSICCEKGLVCKSDDSGPYCAVDCGGTICKKGEYCLSYPGSLDDPPTSGTAYSCESQTSCTTGEQPSYYPNSIGNFYPAYDSEISDEDANKDDFLNNIPSDTTYKGLIAAYSGDDNNKNKGYIAGLPNAIQFQTNNYKKCNSKEVCLSNVQYPYTKQITLVPDGDDMYCNQYKVFEKSSSNNSTNDVADSYSTSTPTENNGIVTLKTQNIKFSDDAPPEEAQGSENEDETDCQKSQNYYSSDLSTFSKCADTECPFKNDDVECPTNDQSNVKSIEAKPQGKNVCILGQDGKFSCTPTTDESQYTYPLCSDESPCSDLEKSMQQNADDFKLPDNCITGEYYYWGDNQPKAGVAQMKYGKCGGGFETGGSCDLQKEFTDPIKNYTTACPHGTKPFFFTDKFDKGASCDCGGGPSPDCFYFPFQGHKAYYSNIQYVCCNEKEFKISDDDFPQPSGPPKNMDYCYPTVYKVQGDTNHSSPSSVLIGRDGSGGSNDPTAEHDGCDIDENKAVGKLKTLLGNANNDIWRSNSDKC